MSQQTIIDSPTKCIVCGKFMSDDQVLLGWTKLKDMGGYSLEEYAHYECYLDDPEVKHRV